MLTVTLWPGINEGPRSWTHGFVGVEFVPTLEHRLLTAVHVAPELVVTEVIACRRNPAPGLVGSSRLAPVMPWGLDSLAIVPVSVKVPDVSTVTLPGAKL